MFSMQFSRQDVIDHAVTIRASALQSAFSLLLEEPLGGEDIFVDFQRRVLCDAPFSI
jgi:hypothetical protein